MALYEDVIKYLNEKNKGGGTSGGIFDNYDESNNPFIIDFDKEEKNVDVPNLIPFDNPIVEAVRKDNEINNPYNMSSMNNPNVRTQRNYTDPRSFMMDAAPKQNFSVSSLLKNLALNALPGMGMISMAKGVVGLLPANKRALMENELLGKGYTLDSLGRIVTDNYNTKEGIMAGYNANKLTEKSFQDRIDTIKETIGRKQAKGLDTSVLENRLDLLDQARADILGSTKTAEELEEEINDFKQSQSFLQKLGIAPGIKNTFFDPTTIGKKAGDVERARIAEIERIAAEEKAKREEMDRMRREIESRYSNQKGEYGGDNRQQEREQAGPGYSDVSEAGSF